MGVIRRVAYMVVCLVLLGAVSWSAVAEAASPPRVAVVVDGPADRNTAIIALLAKEVNTLLESRFPDYAFPLQPTHVGEFTAESAERALAEALADRDYDMVVGLGFQVGGAVGKRESLSKPVFLPFAAPSLQGLPRDGEVSGQRNLAYLTGLVDLERELRRFRDVIRRDRGVYLLDRIVADNVEGLQGFVNERAGESMDVRLIPVDAQAPKILDAVPEDAQAVYIGPLLRLPNDQIQPLIDGLNARGLPTYASAGRDWVEKGAFITLVPGDEDNRRMRRVALFIQETANGGRPESYSTAFERRTELTINMATARRIRVYPRFELMTEAELIDDDPEDRGEELSLRDAVSLGLDANLNLNATRRDADIADAEVDGSWSIFVPRVSVRGNASWIDPDTASPFFNSERSLGYEITGEQLLFGAGAIPGVRAQQAARRGVDAAIQSVELDTIADVATAYLNVLRTRTAERINRENLQRVRRNLALAEVRVEIGTAGRQEVFRWENEIADSRVAVIAASATRNQAEIFFNRVVNRPLEQRFRTVDPAEQDDGAILQSEVAQFVDDPWSFKVFRDFMVEEAQNNSPELRRLREAILSNEKILAGRRQQLFLPDLVVSGGVSHIPVRGGVGADPISGGMGIPERVDWRWQVGAGLSFNVLDYTLYPEIDRAKQVVRQLETERDALAQQVEQGVRSALHQASASRAAVRLRREAASAAEQNLELVTDAYRQGTVNVITLIDAQNQALQANLAAANAVYDFLIDYVAVERAAGEFGFTVPPQQRQAFVERLRRFQMERANQEGVQ